MKMSELAGQGWQKPLLRMLYVLLGAALLWASTRMLVQDVRTHGLPTNIAPGLVLFSCGCYFAAHLMRVFRLVLLADDPGISLRAITRAQYLANGVNLLLPFKLGEAYRVVYFRQFFGSYYRSFIFLLVERLFDFTTILGLFYLARWVSSLQNMAFSAINYFALLLMVLIISFFFVAEECLRVGHRYLVSRYTTRVSVALTRLTARTLKAIEDVKAILSRRLLACLSFTLVIWGLEVLAFTMFFQVLGYRPDAILFLAALVFLSSLLPAGPAGYGGIQLAFFYVGQLWQIDGLIGYSVYYNLFVFMPAMLFALALAADNFWTKRSQQRGAQPTGWAMGQKS